MLSQPRVVLALYLALVFSLTINGSEEADEDVDSEFKQLTEKLFTADSKELMTVEQTAESIRQFHSLLKEQSKFQQVLEAGEFERIKQLVKLSTSLDTNQCSSQDWFKELASLMRHYANEPLAKVNIGPYLGKFAKDLIQRCRSKAAELSSSLVDKHLPIPDKFKLQHLIQTIEFTSGNIFRIPIERERRISGLLLLIEERLGQQMMRKLFGSRKGSQEKEEFARRYSQFVGQICPFASIAFVEPLRIVDAIGQLTGGSVPLPNQSKVNEPNNYLWIKAASICRDFAKDSDIVQDAFLALIASQKKDPNLWTKFTQSCLPWKSNYTNCGQREKISLF